MNLLVPASLIAILAACYTGHYGYALILCLTLTLLLACLSRRR